MYSQFLKPKRLTKIPLLIHSPDPQSWQVDIIIFAHVSVRPLFKNVTQQDKRLFKVMITTGGTEEIIDYTYMSCII